MKNPKWKTADLRKQVFHTMQLAAHHGAEINTREFPGLTSQQVGLTWHRHRDSMLAEFASQGIVVKFVNQTFSFSRKGK